MEKVDIPAKLAALDEAWVPKVVAELNGQHVKVARLEGEYVWHHHEHEDELFWIVEGSLDLHLRDRIIRLDPGEMLVVPRGVEHKPVASEPVLAVLFEPATTRNTGNVDHDYTIEPDDLEHI